ncbi:MAG: hypothetical protein C0513_08555 [Isosphaera sp.]|nr:hypothetical protein [Isosphaera sp.]
MKTWAVWAIVAGVVVAGAGGAAVYFRHELGRGGPPADQAQAFEPAEAVEVVEARRVLWNPTADLVGTVFAIRSVVARNEVPGVVSFVGFDSGSVVEPGQVILRLDDKTERADLRVAQASVRVAEANAAQSDAQILLAELELERLTAVQDSAVAKIEIDRTRSRLAVARADRQRWLAEVDQALARVAQVEARLSKLTVRAPFRARAGIRTVHESQFLAEGVEVVTLQEVTDRIYLDFAVAQEFVPRVSVGARVQATGELLGPDPVSIEVIAADAAVSRDTRNLRVRAVVDNAAGLLVPGMSVQVNVPMEEPRPYTVIPGTAVRRTAYADSVYVLQADERGDVRARQRYVTLGQSVGEDVIVLTGLRQGERIAAAGSFKLFDGAKVLVGPPAQGDGPAATQGAAETAGQGADEGAAERRAGP